MEFQPKPAPVGRLSCEQPVQPHKKVLSIYVPATQKPPFLLFSCYLLGSVLDAGYKDEHNTSPPPLERFDFSPSVIQVSLLI